MFRYFQPRVYIVAATILFATVVAGGAGAVRWHYDIEQMKLESCQRLLMAVRDETMTPPSQPCRCPASRLAIASPLAPRSRQVT